MSLKTKSKLVVWILAGAALAFVVGLYVRGIRGIRSHLTDFHVFKQQFGLNTCLEQYESEHRSSFEDPIPEFDALLKAYCSPLNSSDHDWSYLGSFVAAGHRDLYGNPITIVKIKYTAPPGSGDSRTVHYEARLSRKSLDRLRCSSFSNWVEKLEPTD